METLALNVGATGGGERRDSSSMHTGWGDEKPLDCTRPLFIHPLELARAVYVSMDGRQHPQATGWGRQLWSKSVSWWLRWLCGQQPKQTGGRL